MSARPSSVPPAGSRHARGREVRVLVVEDVPAEADLVIQHVRRLGLGTSLRVVHEEDGYRRALVSFSPHVVVTDYRLARFSARRALKIARAYDAEIPVIMVSDPLSDEKAFRLARLGLANYVFRDRMPRLAPAIVQALDRRLARQREVEARRHAERLEHRLVSVANASGDGVLIADAQRRVMFWNDAASRLLGVSPEHAMGMDVGAFVAEEDRRKFEDFWSRAVAASEPLPPFSVEMGARTTSGEEFPAEVSVACWDDGEERFFSAFLRDISLRRAEARERTLLSRAVEQASDLVIITNRDGRIEYVNPSFERITGYGADEVLGQNPRILKGRGTDPAVYQEMWAELGAGRSFTTEFVNRRKDGSGYLQRSTIFPIFGMTGEIERYVGIGEDVTRERHLERQLRQAQKMEAVGQLTSGIAHDFNNLLTAIIGQAQLLLDELPPEHAAPGEPGQEILTAARRAAELVQRLMVFSRPERATAEIVDIRATLDEVALMVRRVLPESITFTVEHTSAQLPCKLDPGSLQQAVLNLLTNARDATPDGGRITLTTRLERDSDVDGPWAVVEVSDTGHGIEPENQHRVFEPFYTTKPSGKGTGLGLAMVFGFVSAAGGRVEVDSRPEGGATFTLRLPVVTRPAAPPTPGRSAARSSCSPRTSARSAIWGATSSSASATRC
jgi:PAS domain S-box-containing protein